VRRENRSDQVKYYATAGHFEKVKALAEEQRCSVSTFIHGVLLDHLREKLKTETRPERIAAIQHAIDVSTAPRARRDMKPVVRDWTPGGFVYFVKCGAFYKIGRAKNVKLRMAGIQFPEKPRLIKAVHCLDYGFLEKALHALFAHKRTHGEWFDLSDEEVLQAKQYMESRSKS
jgi:hypothetical protein